MTSQEPDAPARQSERLPALDLVRGVAVLAILLANIPHFAAPVGMGEARPSDPSWSDRVVVALTLVFVDGKFITMFSILFGAGLMIQADRAATAGRPFVGYYLRRQGLLLFIGLAHALLLWWGDILTAYAFVGVVALFLCRMSGRAVRWTTAGVFTVAYGGLLIATLGCVVVLGLFVDEVRSAVAEMEQAQGQAAVDPVSAFFQHYSSLEGEQRIYQQGPFLDMVIHRAIHLVGGLFMVLLAIGWYLLGCFLLGATLLRSGVFHDPDGHRVVTRRMILLGLIVGVPCQLAALGCYLAHDPAAPMGIDLWNALAWLLVAWGALALSVGYIGLLLRWSVSGWFGGLQFLLRSVGRMALTNYLMQSVLCGLVFYSYGLGWFGQVSRSQALLVVAGVWLLELIWSPIWLHFFTMGPVEWLWRSLADGRFRPLLRRGEEAL